MGGVPPQLYVEHVPNGEDKPKSLTNSPSEVLCILNKIDPVRLDRHPGLWQFTFTIKRWAGPINLIHALRSSLSGTGDLGPLLRIGPWGGNRLDII